MAVTAWIVMRRSKVFAAGHLADAGAAGRIGQQHQVAREEGAVRAAEVERHAVVAGRESPACGRWWGAKVGEGAPMGAGSNAVED